MAPGPPALEIDRRSISLRTAGATSVPNSYGAHHLLVRQLTDADLRHKALVTEELVLEEDFLYDLLRAADDERSARRRIPLRRLGKRSGDQELIERNHGPSGDVIWTSSGTQSPHCLCKLRFPEVEPNGFELHVPIPDWRRCPPRQSPRMRARAKTARLVFQQIVCRLCPQAPRKGRSSSAI
jgi:hypothetical protein